MIIPIHLTQNAICVITQNAKHVPQSPQIVLVVSHLIFGCPVLQHANLHVPPVITMVTLWIELVKSAIVHV